MTEYKVKYIKRKNKIRKIITYADTNSDIRQYHEKVKDFLRHNSYDSKFAKAYLPKSSIFKNAEAHMYNDLFIKADIKQFFPSIDLKVMEEQLYKEVNKRGHISKIECHRIVKKCSVSKKGLPLGLVSSPSLANLYLKEFDGVLYGLIKKMNIKNPIYTRYADDIVISFKLDKDEKYNDTVRMIIDTIEGLLRKYKLKLNEEKTQIVNLNVSNHVRITGVSIIKDENNYRRISVGRKLKNELFWRSINLYDSNDLDYTEYYHLKGMVAFVLSIEKNGIEKTYSDRMRQLLINRGVKTISELLKNLSERYV